MFRYALANEHNPAVPFSQLANLFHFTEPRINKLPVAVVSPKFQEISLPTSSTVIDGSREYTWLFGLNQII